MRRPLSWFSTHVLPTMVLLLVAVWPLIDGSHTLYLRDAANTHLPAKWSQAEAMRGGRLPLIDPLRDGGQPALGNPNTVPLYPDNLLSLVLPTIWSFNAHFWLHLLLAPWAFFWLARVWGLGRRASWAAGACYAASGFFLSSLNLYNLVAGYALAPALAAAALRLGELAGPRRRRVAALAALWGLLLLAGDPMTAAVALAAALAALAARSGWRALLRGGPWLALGLGTLLAAPQLVEFLRILPASFRGHWGYSAAAAGEASWHPATLFGWLVPFPFGGPDLAFWGQRLFGGDLPLFFALYPGLAALALALAAGRPRRGEGGAGSWAWGLVAAGLFLALGSYNPVVRGLLALPGAGLLRLPVKLWLLVALGAALLAGRGFEGAFGGGRRRPLALALACLGGLLVTLWLGLTLAPAAARQALGAAAPDAPETFMDHERLRWAGLCLAGIAILAICGAVLRLAKGHPRLAGALLIAVHVSSQLLLLRPLLSQEEVAVFERPPELLSRLPPDARLVHAAPDALFGPVEATASSYPDARLLWYQRQTRRQLFPSTGRLWGRRYELTRSPEGLDSFLSRAVAQTLPGLDDVGRLRLLAASGVDHLLMTRPLTGAAAELVEQLETGGGEARGLYVYRLRAASPEILFASSVYRAPHLNGALSRLLEPGFDPLREAVLPGSGPPSAGPGGRVEIVAAGPESLELAVEASGPGALVVHRAHLPLWRAEVDGRPAPVVAANIHRLGLELAAGSHRVRLWVDRRPLWAAALVAVVAAVAVLLLAAPRRLSAGW